MANVQVQGAFAQQVTDGVRGWRAVIRQACSVLATHVVGRSAATANQQAAQADPPQHDVAQPPQHWTPVRPALRTHTSPHLTDPYAAALRPLLRPGAAAQLPDHMPWGVAAQPADRSSTVDSSRTFTGSVTAE